MLSLIKSVRFKISEKFDLFLAKLERKTYNLSFGIFINSLQLRIFSDDGFNYFNYRKIYW